MRTPLLLLDIDGTVSPIPEGGAGPVEGCEEVRLGGIRLQVRPSVVGSLRQLIDRGVQIMWLTTWPADLAVALGVELGLGKLPVPEPAPGRGRPATWPGWKTQTALQIASELEPGRWAWADDGLGPSTRRRLRQDHPEALIIAPSTDIGLTATHMERTEDWLSRAPWEGGPHTGGAPPVKGMPMATRSYEPIGRAARAKWNAQTQEFADRLGEQLSAEVDAAQVTENAWREIDAEFGLLTDAEAAERLERDPAWIAAQRADGKLLAVRRGGDYRYPGFQLDREVLPAIGELITLARQHDRSDESVVLWLCSPSGWMPNDDRPVDHLRDSAAPVVEAARSAWAPRW